jgi:dUTP pyrophosphatase
LYIDLGDVVGCVDNKALIWFSMTMGKVRFSEEMLTKLGQESEVRIKVMKLDASAQLPRYAHTGEFGDLAADLFAVAGVTLGAGATVAVATGVAMEFPSSHGALVEDRSGLAVRGVTTLAGVIDPGYRGEIKVVMTNLSAAAVEIKPGDRIAQLRIVRRIEARFEEVSELAEAWRGANGFGSTGR